MKKSFAIIALLILAILILTSCSKPEDSTMDTTDIVTFTPKAATEKATDVPIQKLTPQPTQKPTPQPTQKPTPKPTPKTTYSPLKKGSEGDAVLQMKLRLYELGYFSTDNVSTQYNDTTAQRVELFQKVNGLPKTGVADSATLELLFSEQAKPTDQYRVLPKTTTKLTNAPISNTNKKAAKSSFEIHFIDVGQGDAALVLCDGKAMLIDGGDSSSSSKIYSYLKNNKISHLDYIVASHPHDDHVGGLSGALNFATVSTVLSPVTTYESDTFKSFVKYLDKQNIEITIPHAGDIFTLGSASIKIVGPVKNRHETNNNSLILQISYGDTTFLFTGDAEEEEEADVVASDFSIKCTVLKVAHHGSSTSSTPEFLKKAAPKYAVISVGKENEYLHPIESTLVALKKADLELFRTDMQGTIICKSDGKEVDFLTERNRKTYTFRNLTPPTATPKPTATISPTKRPTSTPVVKNEKQYVLNINTKKFHYPYCKSVKQMKDKNKKNFTGTRDKVISMGYKPCGNCNP